jgi:hypothetical protein
MSNLNAERNHQAARRRVAGAAGRVAEKQRKAERAAAVQQALVTIDPAYLEKLKHDCLRAANDRLRGASPEDVVREAARDLEGRLRFLTGGWQS